MYYEGNVKNKIKENLKKDIERRNVQNGGKDLWFRMVPFWFPKVNILKDIKHEKWRSCYLFDLEIILKKFAKIAVEFLNWNIFSCIYKSTIVLK